MRNSIFLFLLLISYGGINAQTLQLRSRKADAMTGSRFANSILDPNISLEKREQLIFNEIREGNVPSFLRKLKPITQSIDGISGSEKINLTYYVTPDYFCIGNDSDFFYVPMTPILAQRVANLTKSTLPTKFMVDEIYKHSTIKLEPKPIPPTSAMTTVAVFLAHSDTIYKQLMVEKMLHTTGELTAGNKKDIIISNKIYSENTPKVVVYGWHKLDGKAIQPVYNKHVNLWADYSHGVRLIQNRILLNGKETTVAKILSDPKLNVLLSDEGLIEKPFYPKRKSDDYAKSKN